MEGISQLILATFCARVWQGSTGLFLRADNTLIRRAIFIAWQSRVKYICSTILRVNQFARPLMRLKSFHPRSSLFRATARGSFEMRNYIISSIANVIRRYRATAVDMSRMVNDPAVYQWHVQLCTVVPQPAGDSLQRGHGRLLTTTGNANSGIANLLFGMTELLKPANERLFVESTGSKCQCPLTLGSSGSSRVS